MRAVLGGRKTICALAALLPACAGEVVERPRGGEVVQAPQNYQAPERCARCHVRQYDETQQSVMSGYRSASPLMNALELAGNFAAQAALERGDIRNNLRPVYSVGSDETSPTGKNSVTADSVDTADEARAAFCFGCHAPQTVWMGEDLMRRELPEWTGRFADPDPSCVATGTVACFQKIEGARPLRDYHLVDADGAQLLPETPGGAPPQGALPSISAHGISCDVCHCARGPDTQRSLQGDGRANGAFRLEPGYYKVGPFTDALPAGPAPEAGELNSAHISSPDPADAAYIRSSEFCIACHDVRVPNPNLLVPEGDPSFFRLENLGTEWASQGYAKAEGNPFGEVVRCQDCHMSLYPYGEPVTYDVPDPTTGDPVRVTSPRPGVFATAKAASGEDPTGRGLALPDRAVVSHYFTGVDVPFLDTDELRARLGAGRPGADEPGVDAFGVPRSLVQRRRDLLEAAVRLDLSRTATVAQLGAPFDVRVVAVALTGHNFPAGFSQERTTWIELEVVGTEAGGAPFTLYHSGYRVDQAHPETGELAPDGRLDDEDLPHLEAVVNPFTHDNDVFELGPDAGPQSRIFEGRPKGLVLFRNELLRIYGPAEVGGRPTGIPASNRRHPRTGVVLDHVIEEETFSAGAANAVDNWRALQPLVPRTLRYRVDLPSAQTLADLGVSLTGEIQVKATLHFQQFPPLFLRFLARVSGSVPYTMPQPAQRAFGFDTAGVGRGDFVGRRGPADQDFQLIDEARIDRFSNVVQDIARASLAVRLEVSP